MDPDSDPAAGKQSKDFPGRISTRQISLRKHRLRKGGDTWRSFVSGEDFSAFIPLKNRENNSNDAVLYHFLRYIQVRICIFYKKGVFFYGKDQM